MAFSCFSVIGSAALTKTDITYDNIDDAALTKEQVSTLALDLVDNDLLAGMDPVDLSIVGTLRLDSIDHALADIYDLRNGFIWSIGKGLLGDVGDLMHCYAWFFRSLWLLVASLLSVLQVLTKVTLLTIT